MYIEIDVHILSLAVLAVVLASHYKNSRDSLFRQRFFRGMVLSCMAVLAMSTAALIARTQTGAAAQSAHMAFRSLYFLFCGLFCLMWTLFCALQWGQKVKRYQFLLLCLPLTLLIVFLLLNLGSGLLFAVSGAGVYARGPFFHIVSVCFLAYAVYSFVLLLRHMKNRAPGEAVPYLLVPLAAAAVGIVQLAVDGVFMAVWPAAAVALLVMQLHMLGEKANIDHLTGLYNRKYIDGYVEDLLMSGRMGYSTRSGHSFAALMLDIDGFKTINDSFGHVEGDRAIAAAAALLKKSVRKGDFVSRYGGDEFLVILDHCSKSTPKRVIGRIRENLRRFNGDHARPYKLEFSIGYKLFSGPQDLTAADVFSSIDELMYQNKQSKPSKNSGGQPARNEYNRTQQ